MNIYRSYVNSPVGPLLIEATDNKSYAVHFTGSLKTNNHENLISQKTVTQTQQYFNGKRRRFTIPLQQRGTEFQQKVWHWVKWTNYAATRTYLDIALHLGDKKLVRAVGHANGVNPYPIVLPCHRIIGSNNKLVGYIGGLKRKALLLEHERSFKPNKNDLL